MSSLLSFTLLRFSNDQSDKQLYRSSNRAPQPPAQTKKPSQSSEFRKLTRHSGRKLHLSLEGHPPSTIAKLQLLPAELYLHLTTFLPNSSIVALSYTCGQFLRWSPVVVENLFDRFHSASETSSRLDDQERFKRTIKAGPHWAITRGPLSLMLRGYQRERFCHSCHTAHSLSEFSITALRDPRSVCIRSEGRLWVCPSVSWTFDQTIAVNRSAGHPDHEAFQHCGCRHHFTRLHTDTTTTSLVLAYLVTDFARPGNVTNADRLEFIRAALKSTHLRICPHLSISDRPVRRRFASDCKRTFEMTADQCGCRVCSGRMFGDDEVACPVCFTKVQFRRKVANGTTYLYLVTAKSIDERFLSRNRGRMWRRCVTLPSEMGRLGEEWGTASFESYGTVTLGENPFDGGRFVL
ncbi:MAG: hypothetical protein LQ346_009069 [Caloplaca aetnensis]|nr:MAG: hypothetical protein LQ346_009069 [Caloplaca aetnensis]